MEKSHRQKRMLEKFLAYTKNCRHHFSSTITMNTILFYSFLTHFLVMFSPNQITQNFFFLEFLTWSHIHLIKKAQFLYLESIKAAITFIFFWCTIKPDIVFSLKALFRGWKCPIRKCYFWGNVVQGLSKNFTRKISHNCMFLWQELIGLYI